MWSDSFTARSKQAALREEVERLTGEVTRLTQESAQLKQDLGYVVRYLYETYQADKEQELATRN